MASHSLRGVAHVACMFFLQGRSVFFSGSRVLGHWVRSYSPRSYCPASISSCLSPDLALRNGMSSLLTSCPTTLPVAENRWDTLPVDQGILDTITICRGVTDTSTRKSADLCPSLAIGRTTDPLFDLARP
eukprot:CAMPEP_0180205188 /NCGR_PEP_ID=MMETSP0987-20121128/8844_1 /TAXON_ID=697907 /ORGANISM="non described non described, Strain CCMP2293" /LENGTH=129 /DNA_ID=CAMNT_0022160793 /DNA_START=155 /DNA_END=541 /DNA_ORIENTATION=-